MRDSLEMVSHARRRKQVEDLGGNPRRSRAGFRITRTDGTACKHRLSLSLLYVFSRTAKHADRIYHEIIHPSKDHALSPVLLAVRDLRSSQK